MIEMRTKFGFRRFMLLAPNKTIRFSGFPVPEVYAEIGELIQRLKKNLAPYDIEVYGKSSNRRYAWANVVGRLGIPHTAANGKVKMVSGSIVEIMRDNAITELLRGSVFLMERPRILCTNEALVI
jgi:hypothetical protein